jgi:hypothetical protein
MKKGGLTGTFIAQGKESASRTIGWRGREDPEIPATTMAGLRASAADSVPIQRRKLTLAAPCVSGWRGNRAIGPACQRNRRRREIFLASGPASSAAAEQAKARAGRPP